MPIPSSPQVAALESQADILFYGGAAGGGKTDLLIGAAVTQHQRSIIFRRQFPQLKGIRERAEDILRERGRFSSNLELWRIDDGRRLEFGAVDKPNDVMKYQGRAHDLKAFDEITHFHEEQFRFLIGWARSALPGQRARVIAAGNPPTDAEGDWVISFWGPWLDPQHPNPAADGELRWYATVNGKDVERPNGDEFEHFNTELGRAEMIKPLSRTFIRAKVQDNPYLMAGGYVATLQSLPEPLRSKMLLGDFTAGREDPPDQVIPTAWIVAAQQRWEPNGHHVDGEPRPMDAIGVDVARGGKDKTVLTPRHGTWFAQQIIYPGSDTPDGMSIAGFCKAAIPTGENPRVQIDAIGVGSSPYDAARAIGLDAHAMVGTAGSKARDKSGKLGFVNARAEMWWNLREALDPNADEPLALPPDRELMADLSAPRWMMRINGIQIESKLDIIKRIGRSPDKGESVVYAFARPRALPDWLTKPAAPARIRIYAR